MDPNAVQRAGKVNVEVQISLLLGLQEKQDQVQGRETRSRRQENTAGVRLGFLQEQENRQDEEKVMQKQCLENSLLEGWSVTD